MLEAKGIVVVMMTLTLVQGVLGRPEGAEDVVRRMHQAMAGSISLQTLPVSESATTVTVSTPQGTLLGTEENGIRSWKGIPFAEPPVGDLRWAPPVPLESSGDVTVDCTAFRSACPQIHTNATSEESPFISVALSEDCLYLNVWTPATNVTETAGGLPVLVWIHGGAFSAGWGGDPLYTPNYVINSTENVVVVTLQYRLGALGFLATTELAGNYGFLDQQLALQWVQQNIALFGGNPDHVTIFGCSAGGMSVTLHTVSPYSKGLFSRAIAESNPAGILYRTPQESYPYSEKLAGLVGCNVTDVACLRSVGWQEIVDMEGDCFSISQPFSSTDFLIFYPLIDGDIIPGQPLQLLKSSSFNKAVQSMTYGTNRNETLAFLPDIPLTASMYEAFVDWMFEENGAAVLAQYPPVQHSDNLNQLSILSTDWLFTCPVRASVRATSNAGTSSYLYTFLHPPSNDPVNGSHKPCDGAVCHSGEYPFVFHSDAFVEAGSMTDAELSLSWDFVDYWKSVAMGSFGGGQWGPAWPLYSEQSDTALGMDVPLPYLLEGYHAAKCAFWDDLGYQL